MPSDTNAPVIVTPIPASQSRTIRRAKLMMVGTAIAAVLPDIVQFFLNLTLTDPAFASEISRWLPAPIRYVAMTAIMAYAKNQITLRKSTVAPIAGTPSAAAATLSTSTREDRTP
jgi:hypothetical protein